jgi:hypothetical protein
MTIHSSYLPAYEDGTECSETSAYQIQAPGYYPEESIQEVELLRFDEIMAKIFLYLLQK